MVRSKIIPKMDVNETNSVLQCEVCLKGKMTALPFKKTSLPCKETLEIVHSDVVGPFRTELMEGAKYFVTFIDDSTRWCEVYFLRQKCAIFEAFKMYQKFVEKLTEKRIKLRVYSQTMKVSIVTLSLTNT